MSDNPSIWRSRFAEAVVITASILVAFGIDAWWGAVQQADDDRSHLSNVRRELEATDELLDDAIRLHDISQSLALQVLEMTSAGHLAVPEDSLNSIVAKLFNSYVINPPTGALQAAIMSGAVARLDDEVLKSQLLGWDSLLEDLLEEERSGLEGIRLFLQFLAARASIWGPISRRGITVSGETVGEGNWALPRTRHAAGVGALINDRAFENQILLLLANARSSYDEATAFRQSLREALARLDATLH